MPERVSSLSNVCQLEVENTRSPQATGYPLQPKAGGPTVRVWSVLAFSW